MDPIVECVPNFSEGRDPAVIQSLEAVVRGFTGLALLDRHTDADHHRTVLTIAGRPEAIVEVAFELVRSATALIDLTAHSGEHPKVGATDVVPFVPLRGTSMAACIELAKHVGARVGAELKIPVFLYEEACPVRERRYIEVIRRGGLGSLADRMKANDLWTPDFGPAVPHPSAGVVVVGARSLLIAYNIVLQTNNLAIAKTIAQKVRTSGEGLPSLKAIGVNLKSRSLVQVSMNLTNYQETSMEAVFEAVSQEAEELGVTVVESEIVGLIPQAALTPPLNSHLKFKEGSLDHVLETRLMQAHLD